MKRGASLPLRVRNSQSHDPSNVRRLVAPSLRQAEDEILVEVGVALEGLNTEKPSGAVHGYRVALKRWRALLRLLRDPIGDEVVALRQEASQLSQEFGRSRDAQAALDALNDIVGSKEIAAPSISERTQATIADRLEGIRKTSETIALDAAALQRLRVGLARASASASVWPLERMSFEDVATALTQSYRRARRRLPCSWETASAEDVHKFRKALVTFRYQVELIEPLWPKVWRTYTGEVQKLRLHLGKSNDLIILSGLAQPKQPLAHWRSRLAPRIESQRQFHLNRARILASRVLAESPRSFQKRIEAMWKAATAAEFN
jgi:CHAD domain-containing protein